MSGFLEQATTVAERESEPLKELARKSHAASGKVLAVAERAGGTLILCREREQGKRGEDGKRSRDNGTEKVLKPTSDLADFAHAVESGLL